MKKKDVIVYSCSGCSNVAQLANNIAVKLHRNGIARMSCIAGVGGDVKPLLKVAQSAEKILALDGCPLQCAKHCLERHGLEPDKHIVLTEHGLTKDPNQDVTEEIFKKFYDETYLLVDDLKHSK